MRAGRARGRAPEGVVWPMPLPFSELHLSGASRNQSDIDRKLGINFLVLVLNSLKYQEGKCLGFFPGFGTKLNRAQWDLVRRLGPHVEAWNAEPPVGPDEMGRAASKVESVEQVLARLLDYAEASQSKARAYGQRVHREADVAEVDSFGALGSCAVMGTMQHSQDPVAKRVQPSRFKFWEVPGFDPSKFLDDHNRDTLLFPSHPPEPEVARPPRVRVHISKKDVVPLLETLDGCSRLKLLPEDKIRMPFRNGMFSIPKDALRDRMVLDARPPNCLEDGRGSDWIGSLGSVAQFNHWFLRDDESAVVFSEDIREYYHAFLISPQRVRRNALALEVAPHEISHLDCFEPWMWKCKRLVPCLATMAMGDCRAVTYGQVAHLSCLLRCPELTLDSFITLRGRPARGDLLAGLMIDDFLLVEKRKMAVGTSCDEVSVGQRIVEQVRRIYEEVGLPRHAGKSVEAEHSTTFWGVGFDGMKGTVRPSCKRATPVIFIVLQMLKLGYTSVGLLEVLAGSFVSIFQCRRRFMSVLDFIYKEQKSRPRSAVLKISPALANELLQCIGLTVMSCIDLRIKPSSKLVATDASPWATAGVVTDIGEEAAAEFHKYALQKGWWNKLMSPVQAYLREKGLLPDDGQLPDEATYDMRPLWEEIVLSKRFELFGKIRKRRGRQHINIGEIDAALEAEELHGSQPPDRYYIHLQDSQVSLACLVKGRSSSRAINAKLRGSIPGHVQHNSRPFYGYVRSKKNPSDAPTRSRPIEAPLRAPPSWLEAAERGDFSEMESFFESVGCDLKTMRGLPPEEEFWEPCDVDVRSCSMRRSLKRRKLQRDRVSAAGKPKHRVKLSEASRGVGSCEGSGGGPLLDEFSAPTSPPSVDLSPPFAGAVGASGLSESLRAVLRTFDSSQFLLAPCFDSLEAAFDSGPGILGLFAGSRGFSKACVASAPVWCLTFDLAHSPSEDLLSPPVQESILILLRGGAFAAMGAGPVCASFSQAITPPCRTKEHPGGVPWCSELQQLKNDMGNRMLAFVLECAKACLLAAVVFWIENPHGSWIWRQPGSLSWDEVCEDDRVNDMVVDYCRFNTPWRKRTRFRTSSATLGGQRCLCQGGHKHVALRGRCKSKGVSYTKLAEPYPRGVCSVLAWGVLADVGLLPKRRKLDVNLCARDSCRRIGEAQHPGPKSRVDARPDVWLGDVQLLEPATVALRGRIWSQLCRWFNETFGASDPLQWLEISPLLFVHLLVAFGHHCYEKGVSLATYRQLLAHCSKKYPQVKPVLGPAWETVSKWELQEPIQRRPPIPKPVLLAMASVALSWGWVRWTAVTLAGFFSVSRLGELLRVKRSEILTPSDLLQSEKIIYIRFSTPKTRRRGARIQYTTIEDAEVVRFLCKVWNGLEPTAFLYPASQSAYRSRWDAVLKALRISSEFGLTPGGLRGGGAVYLHRSGLKLTELMWRMRLQHAQTLGYYLQETVAVSLLPSLPTAVRLRVQARSEAFPHFIA
eukprot:Skav221346  [mRNA]  locus=scaffold1845:125657:130120:- [translate_table: standard]